MRWLAAGLRAWPLALLLTLAAPAGAHAQAAPALPAITLGDGPPRLDGEELGSLWLDATGSAGIDQVAGGDLHLKPGSTSAIHDFGDRGALWIHYRLALAPYTRQGWLITLPSPVLDFVRLWQRDADGQWRSQTAGDTVAVDAWPEPGRYPSFRLDLEPGQSHDVYLQVRSQTPTSVPVRLESEAAHAQQLQVEYLGLGVAFGALVLLIASCAAQSWAYRDRIYGWYAAYAAATMLGLMAYTGVAAHLLWTGSGFWADALQGSLALLATGAAVLFVRSLAGIAVRHRVLARVTAVAGPLGGVLALAYPFLARPLALGLVAAYMACAVALNVLVAWLSWRRRDSVGLWVLLAYAPLATAVLLSLARVFGWLPASFGTLYAIVVATALEVPAASLCLATTRWWSAQAATCGRWVTARTWRSRPNCFISRPTVSATAPPTPASTSSKIRVWAAPSWLVVTAMASAMRESSPPEATLPTRRGVLPAWPATRKPTSSSPPSAGSAAWASATSKRPPCMPRPCMACVMALASCGAALLRSRETSRACAM